MVTNSKMENGKKINKYDKMIINFKNNEYYVLIYALKDMLV